MASFDLGKQIGPLPLGAWIVVVGAGLGIAYYTRQASSGETEEVVDDSSDAGVGTGQYGGWTTTTASDEIAATAVTTNEQWAVRAINDLIAQGYNSVTADSAIRKYVAGVTLSITETALLGIALSKWGSPPQPLEPVEGGTGTTGGGTTTTTNSAPPAPTGMRVASITSVSAKLVWNRSSGAVRYRVYRSGGGTATISRDTVGTGPGYTWLGLKPKTNYSFSVAAINAAGKRSASTSNIVKTKTK